LPILRKELTELHGAAEESMEELRRSLRMMQQNFDLVAALSDYCRVAAARQRLDVRFSRNGRARSVGPESALAMFRVLQESLTNAGKHCGRGTLVEVTLSFARSEARLAVQDRGKGFELPDDPAALSRAGHYGLANMRERANKVGGRIHVAAEPGRGTRIELSVHAGEEIEP
jgi:two-component system, NarL family, sensor histidine kinase DegS